MLFNSLHFLIFYGVVLIAYFSTPHRYRWGLLLAASYYFYMAWQPWYALLLVGLTLIGYFTALLIDNGKTASIRRIWLISGIVACVGLLVYFKYLDFFMTSIAAGLRLADLQWQAPLLHLIIPVGISFHTFQTMGYLIDVHQRKIDAERHLGIYALFIVFFPQLLAGPIERSGHMLPQFHREHLPTYARISSGARWALWGLFKKMAIADLLSPFVNRVYAEPHGLPGSILLLATFFFTIQIYCDFSGYSDIALGVARILGYDLMVNFRQPYLSRSISEFWSRWHISLSTWFRDYVYIPLGGNRVSKARWALNVLIVFLLSGMWHGASVLFILWGLLHGVYLLGERLIFGDTKRADERRGVLPKFTDLISMPVVFVLVMIGWVLFRAQSLGDAGYILGHLWRIKRIPVDSYFSFGLPRFEFMLAFAVIGLLFCVEGFLRFRPAMLQSLWDRRPVRWGLYAATVYGIVFFGVLDRVEFIYFQF